MNKVYTRINWENGEDGNTPLNENNLNKMDAAIDEIDNRVLELANSGSGSGGGSITVDSELSETSENPVQNKVITARLEEVFQSVSNGKKLIASALTDKGFNITSDATFSEMANCINLLNRERTLVYNKTFASEEESLNNVFFSSWYGSYDRTGYKAFDGNTGTQWCCQPTENMNGEYIGYTFGELIYPSVVKITIKNSNESNPSFILQGSKDLIPDESNEWVDLTEEMSIVSSSDSNTVNLNLDGLESYAMYRLLFTAGKQSGGYGTDVYEIAINGYKYE